MYGTRVLEYVRTYIHVYLVCLVQHAVAAALPRVVKLAGRYCNYIAILYYTGTRPSTSEYSSTRVHVYVLVL